MIGIFSFVASSPSPLFALFVCDLCILSNCLRHLHRLLVSLFGEKGVQLKLLLRRHIVNTLLGRLAIGQTEESTASEVDIENSGGHRVKWLEGEMSGGRI